MRSLSSLKTETHRTQHTARLDVVGGDVTYLLNEFLKYRVGGNQQDVLSGVTVRIELQGRVKGAVSSYPYIL